MPAAPPAVFVPPSGAPTAPPGVFIQPSGAPSDAVRVFEPAPAGKGTLLISGVSTAGVNGYVQYIGIVNGLPAWSRDGTMQQLDGINVILYGLAGFWYLARDAYTPYAAIRAIGVSPTPDAAGGGSWGVTTGSGVPTLTASAAPPPPAIFTP